MCFLKSILVLFALQMSEFNIEITIIRHKKSPFGGITYKTFGINGQFQYLCNSYFIENLH